MDFLIQSVHRITYMLPRCSVMVRHAIFLTRIHYNDVIMGSMASQITSLTIVYPAVYSGADQRKHQSSASLAFVRGIHRGPVNSPHKWPVTRKMIPFDDVIMYMCRNITGTSLELQWASTHRQFDCLLNWHSKQSMPRITGYLWGETPENNRLPARKAINTRSVYVN